MNTSTRTTRGGLLLTAGLVAVLLGSPSSTADEKPRRKNRGGETVGVASKTTPAAKASNLTARIDDLVDRKLKAENVPASPRADDAEFMRRAYLDITGAIPTAGSRISFWRPRASSPRS